VLSLLCEIVTAPSIPDSELMVRKGEVVTSIRQDADNPAVRAVEGLMTLLYPGHPYGRPLKGTVESVEAVRRADLLRLHQQQFAPNALSVVIVGDVEASRAIDAAAAAFGPWTVSPAPGPALPSIARRSERVRRVIPMMNKAQADIAYGFVAIARRDPAYYAFSLMNNVLGQYSMGGRLGDRIRERQGMAYYVFSSFDGNVQPGPLMIRAGVAPAHVDRAIASIDEEISRFAADGALQKELDESRQYLIGSMPRALETNAGIAGFLQTSELFDLGLDYDLRLPDLLRAVTLDQVNAAARQVLDPSAATVVVAGPYEDQDATA
jgi:zinc protease